MIIIKNKNKFIIFFSLFIFSLFLRILLSQFLNFNFPDALAYKRIAEQFIMNLNYDSESSMPLYPLMMALSDYLFGNLYLFYIWTLDLTPRVQRPHHFVQCWHLGVKTTALYLQQG